MLAELPVERGHAFAAIALVTAALLPHAGHIHWPVIAFFLVCVAISLLSTAFAWPRLGRWLMLPLLALGVWNVWRLYGVPIGQQPGVALLVSMTGLKLLEIRRRRDILVLVYLGWFAIATQFFFESGLLMSAYLLLVALLLATLLMQLNRRHFDRSVFDSLRRGLLMAAQGLPAMLLLFYLFPRFDSPLWNLHIEGAGLSGLDDNLTMGDISNLSLSSEAAFRASGFADGPPPPAQRYWRGPVLWDTDGRHWQAGELSTAGLPDGLRATGKPLDYEIMLEPSGRRWLYALDLPARIPPGSRLGRDFVLHWPTPIRKRFRYEVGSYIDATNVTLSAIERQRASAVPADISQRVRDFATRQREGRTAIAYVQRILDHYRQQPFVYTLKPPRLGRHAVDEFLFETRKGFCEHYASSFVILMRLGGIPARIVTGYQGGEYNPHGDFLLIRQSDAHAWAEIWLGDSGWMRVDPTAAVAPERIERPLDNDIAGDGAPVRFRLDGDSLLGGLLREARWLGDSVQLGWSRWVVNFDRTRQRNLLGALGLDWLKLPQLIVLAVVSSLLMIGLLAWMLQKGRRRRVDPIARQYARFNRRLARAGVQRRPWEGPFDLQKRIEKERPTLAAATRPIIQLYIRLRYAREPRDDDARRLGALVRRFRPQRVNPDARRRSTASSSSGYHSH